MTKFVKNIAFLCLILISASGCFKEQFGGQEIEEGVPTEVSLNFDVLAGQLVTKAAQAREYEFKVYSLYLYVFDNDGAVLYQHYFDKAGNATDRYGNAVSLAFDSDAADKGTLKFKTVTALDAKIVAIANVTETAVSETAYTLTEEMLDNVNSYSALQELVMVGQSSVSRGSIFMMTGVARNSDNSEEIDITTSGTPLNCTIQLDRADAKVEFRVLTGTPAAGVTNLSFIPNQWRVINVPKESMVMPKSGNYDAGGVLLSDADVANGASYFNTEWTPFEIKSSITQPVNGFTFYMPENRQKPRELITVAGLDGVKLREEKLHQDLSQDQIDNSTRPGHTFNNTDFKYADLNATYVEFTGTLSYNQNDSYVSVLARFTIHLGQTQKSGTYTPNDYETKRNTHYVYNIKINGANDIEVEVKDSTPGDEKEENPGYTGEVVKNSNYVYQLDSHFERRVLAVDRNMIDEQMTWGVSTLYSRGIHDYANPNVETDLRDYKWVKFAINVEHGAAANKFVTYPGNHKYHDPDAAVGLIVGSTVYPEGYATSAVTEKPLYDVNQLVKKLKEIKSDNSYFDSNGRVWITAFIDEYVYYKNPITYLNAAGNKNNQAHYTSFWKNTVNAQERLLHFITTDAKYSPDGESSVVNTVFTFRQKAIKSLFNVNAGITTSWGIENLQEGKRLAMTPSTSGNANLYNSSYYNLNPSLEAGRENTIRWWSSNSGLQFNTVMDNNATVTENGVVSPDPYAYTNNYSYIPYACLNRNRDENGNGRIDESEVRWYLASVRNIVDFFIGQPCFDDSEHLYPGVTDVIQRNQSENNPARNGYFTGNSNISWHYGTSTFKGSECDIVWAEEGCATGSYGWSVGSGYGGIGNKMFAYRCVRDLGAHYEQDETVDVKHLYDVGGISQVSVEGNNYNVKTIDLSLYNPASLRTNKETNVLPDHTEQGVITVGGQNIGENGNSKTYSKFQYIVNDNGTGRTFGAGRTWAQCLATNPCPAGWRMPNVRELAVMAMLEPGDGWSSYASTRYSLQNYFTNNSNRDGRPSFEYDGGNLSVENHGTHGTRCVRDYDGS